VVVVHLQRIGNGTAGPGGRFDTTYNLYESEETVLLLADPRARTGYTRQGSVRAPGEAPDMSTEDGPDWLRLRVTAAAGPACPGAGEAS
jgi:hypothetical protein